MRINWLEWTRWHAVVGMDRDTATKWWTSCLCFFPLPFPCPAILIVTYVVNTVQHSLVNLHHWSFQLATSYVVWSCKHNWNVWFIKIRRNNSTCGLCYKSLGKTLQVCTWFANTVNKGLLSWLGNVINCSDKCGVFFYHFLEQVSDRVWKQTFANWDTRC